MIFIQKGALYFATEELDRQGMAGKRKVLFFFFFPLYCLEVFSDNSLHPLGCRKELSIAVEDEMSYSFIHSTNI